MDRFDLERLAAFLQLLDESDYSFVGPVDDHQSGVTFTVEVGENDKHVVTLETLEGGE